MIAQIIGVAREHQPDAVLIAGDLYDASAPSADAQQLVVQALLALRDTGAQVIAIAGNHDSAATFDAYRPLMGAAGITLVGSVRTADTRRRGELRRPLDRRAGQRRRPAVPVPALRGPGRPAHLVHSVGDVEGLRRHGP